MGQLWTQRKLALLSHAHRKTLNPSPPVPYIWEYSKYSVLKGLSHGMRASIEDIKTRRDRNQNYRWAVRGDQLTNFPFCFTHTHTHIPLWPLHLVIAAGVERRGEGVAHSLTLVFLHFHAPLIKKISGVARFNQRFGKPLPSTTWGEGKWTVLCGPRESGH